jgi:hypothetical protein
MRLRTTGVGVAVAVAAVAATGASGGSSGGTITTIAGTGKAGFSGDGGQATAAQLRSVHGVTVDRQGNLYIADFEDHRVRRVSPDGTITTFAGRGAGGGSSGDGGPATLARLDGPQGIAVDGQGNVYISDYNDYRVRKVSPGGTITTFAGTGIPGSSGDGGPATSARLYAPSGVAVDGQGNVYIVDSYNQRVRKVSAGGTITTIAGTGRLGFSGDGGPATSAQLSYPSGVAVDGQGNVYIVDANRVRKVSRGGTITTFAGTGAGGFSGDGGPATSAQVRPTGVGADSQGNIYIADFYGFRVRKVSPGGMITTFAGTGGGGFSGDGGPATSARLYGPYAVAVDGQGNVYIADDRNYRVRKVGTSGTARATYAGFYSPSRNLSCEMADGSGGSAARVSCQSRMLPRSVSMGLAGRLTICRGARCLGDVGENIPTLGYSKQITVGRFRCLSLRTGIRCTVIQSRKGFLINRDGVRRVGP